jgi:hypothetical protein
MTLAKAKAKANETFIVQASLKINTYNRQNMFIVQATDLTSISQKFHLSESGILQMLLKNSVVCQSKFLKRKFKT